MSGKSILDNVTVTDTAFPLSQHLPENKSKSLTVVSACPSCGAPIYGLREVQPGQAAPVKYSCCCSGRDLASTTHGK